MTAWSDVWKERERHRQEQGLIALITLLKSGEQLEPALDAIQQVYGTGVADAVRRLAEEVLAR